MPIYTKETIKNRLPWVEIHDWEFFVLGRAMAAGVPRQHSTDADESGHKPYWGYMQDNPLQPYRRIEKTYPSERIQIISGTVAVETANGRFTLNKRDYIDVPDEGLTIVGASSGMPEIAHIKGDWKRTIRSEVFYTDPTMMCDYHYHDGNEYWVIFRGNFELDFAGRKIPVGPGTLMAAGAGLEHGVLNPPQALQAIVMAMPLDVGDCRDGHLVRDKHGAPQIHREMTPEAWAQLDALSVGEIGDPFPVMTSEDVAR